MTTDLRAQVVETIRQVMWDSGTAEAALDAALDVLGENTDVWLLALSEVPGKNLSPIQHLLAVLRAGKGSDE